MTERLLQYIWQFQYYNAKELTSKEGEAIQILHPGMYNTNQGPDFINAKIKIDNTIWAGSIELHTKSSDWKNHKHSNDINYKNVVLHVVWEQDIELDLPFSTLLLQDKVSKLLLQKYEELMNASSFIPCENGISEIKDFTWQAWKERLLIDRLELKTKQVLGFHNQTNHHWEETLWWMLARNFGAKINSDAFEKIAQSIPLNILAKHKGQIHQLEALLFGQTGLLETEFNDAYPILLKKEYQFLKVKYKLKTIEAPVYFLRMRPSNFPTIRLAQLAMLVHDSLHLFSKIKETKSLTVIRYLLNITANDYWHYHYVFDEPSDYKQKKLGTQMIDNIIINTFIPILFAYGHHQDEDQYKTKALSWLEEIRAEKNTITKGFESLNLDNKTSFDSQAFIQLKNEFCDKKRCLDCSIGNKLLSHTLQEDKLISAPEVLNI